MLKLEPCGLRLELFVVGMSAFVHVMPQCFMTTRIALPSVARVVDRAETYMSAEGNDGFSGAILIARDGEPILHRAYGQASIELNVSNTPQTVFRVGSITKQFTAAAVMLLQERGTLRVSDSICDHLTNCPDAWKPITVHHLLNHTSGIVSYTSLPEFKTTLWEPLEHQKLIDLFRNVPLESAPGEKWNYNNSGYYLLGVLIETLTGESYGDFLDKNIFRPLGMTNSGFDAGYRIIPNLATGYSRIEGVLTRNALTGFNAYSAGALFSTCEDLLKWDRALYTDQIISRESRNAMFTLGDSLVEREAKYGYGVGFGEVHGFKSIFHGGWIFGFVSDFHRFPEMDVTVILLSNNDATNLGKFTQELAEIALADS
jgi:CubicO group peptidase (beta-lactamase class C family)